MGVSYVITTLLERHLNDRFQTNYPIIVCERAYVQPDRIVTIATYLHYQAAYVIYAPSKLTTLELAHQLETRLAPYINKIKELEKSEPTLVIEPLKGWRSYRFTNNHLVSLVTPTEACLSNVDGWSNAALCNKGRQHSAPAIECTCGHYAMATRGDIIESIFDIVADRDDSPFVLAEVEAKGTIIRHTQGWRSEYIRPVKFELMNMCQRDEFLDWADTNVPEAEIVV